jgi:ABC-2 type transport system ATP-binding protein
MSVAATAPIAAALGTRQNGASVTVLETHDLTKRFKQLTAVDHLDLNVRSGEVLGFLGPNGAGKSTTVGMILGLIRPTSGTVRLFGKDPLTQHEIVSKSVGAIIENPAFYPYLSGRDNLLAHAKMLGGVPKGRLDELLTLVGLRDRAKDKFKTYSLGMKQRLGIASTLLNDPALVILDEPTNGLDPAGQREIREIIPNLADQGHAVLLASHMLHEVEQVCDRVAIVRKGKLIEEGEVQEMLRRGEHLEVTIADADLRQAAALVEQVPGVSQVTVENGRLRIAAPERAGADINRQLATHGLFAGSITPRHNSLEEFFLELTEGETSS